MICASCDREIPDSGVICKICNPPAKLVSIDPDRKAISHRDLTTTLRHLKGLVMLSVLFGILAAPFAIWLSSKALARFHEEAIADAATYRQFIILRRVATGLLLFWALMLGAELKLMIA